MAVTRVALCMIFVHFVTNILLPWCEYLSVEGYVLPDPCHPWLWISTFQDSVLPSHHVCSIFLV